MGTSYADRECQLGVCEVQYSKKLPFANSEKVCWYDFTRMALLAGSF